MQYRTSKHYPLHICRQTILLLDLSLSLLPRHQRLHQRQQKVMGG